MPIFHYGGVELDLDWVISYARVSSPSQTVEQGGGGIDRQIDEFHAFRTEVGVNEYTGLGSLVDDGKSGSTGKNIATGALGDLPSGRAALVTDLLPFIAAFDRFWRCC